MPTISSSWRRNVALPVMLLSSALRVVSADVTPWNNPYPADNAAKSILYSVFQERPKHLDPVSSYSENEAVFTGQIYEPPLQYHFLKRPYELIPLTATAVPEAQYFDARGKRLPDATDEQAVAKVIYRITLRPGITFAPHPAFARRPDGSYYYHALSPEITQRAFTLNAFPETGTRELIADDYVYEIKRLAHPHLHSPVASFLGKYITGLNALARELRHRTYGKAEFIDLRAFDLLGARVIDRYTFEITLSKPYPQFVYWLAMSFFAPVPWEADAFYSQPGMAEHNLTLEWYPVGTGPYVLNENNPNRRMVLRRNPNFHLETYPDAGEPSDGAHGWLAQAGQRLPFIDEVHFMLEKEDIPEWNKFQQGYYDTSGIAPDGFDQAIRVGPTGQPELTDTMRAHDVRLAITTQPSLNYIGFNMLDPVVGGNDRRARLLRRALSIAFDTEELISIFGNGRGIPAQGPIPPGIFGFKEAEAGVNPLVYDWRQGRAVRKSLDQARHYLAQAGYPGGRDPASGKPLVLYFDAATTGPDLKSQFSWYRKQFEKLGLELVVRSTDYNRFQEKMHKGDAQIYSWGWNADYPDPENFLFLLYGPNGKVRHQGENASNYANPAYDALFQRMRVLPNGAERQRIIDQMVALVREDSPWIWGFHPQAFTLYHQWVGNAKPNLLARNSLKYRTVDPVLRAVKRREWNPPRLWPLLLVLIAAVVSIVPAVLVYRRRRYATAL